MAMHLRFFYWAEDHFIRSNSFCGSKSSLPLNFQLQANPRAAWALVSFSGATSSSVRVKVLGKKYIGIFVLVLIALSFCSREFNLWFHGMKDLPYVQIPFIAVYERVPLQGDAGELKVYCDGNGKYYVEDRPTSEKFAVNAIDDFKACKRHLIYPKDKYYFELDFLNIHPYVDLYEPSFRRFWETLPLGNEKIGEFDCVGWKQNGLHRNAPIDHCFDAIGMRLEVVESPDRKSAMDEYEKLWFDKESGILVKGHGMTLKSLKKEQPPADVFKVPEGFRKMWLP